MKISDEQRREVAARMRDIMRRHPNCFLDNMVAQSVLDVMGDGLTIGETVADLIDRPTTHIEVNEHGRAYCPNCGCDDWCLADGSHYCPNCGAEVVHDA